MNSEKKYLRDSDHYPILLKHFSKAMIGAGTFRKCSKKQLLSAYMGPSLEAFLVLTYMNNYDKWMSEAGPPRGVETSTAVTGTSSVSFLSVGEITVGTRWTEKSRGAGKDKGWAPASQKLHEYLTKLIKIQRQQSEGDRIAFETGLQQYFAGESVNSTSNCIPDDEVVALRNDRMDETYQKYSRKRLRGQYEHASVTV
jgi:hypothetical protein